MYPRQSTDINDDERDSHSHELGLQVTWRNVKNETKGINPKNLINKQEEETARLDNIRKTDLKGYIASLTDICNIKSASSSMGQKMRCIIPNEFFDKRIQYKIHDIEDEKRTSLDVHLPLRADDYISRQTKYRRGLTFKKLLNNQEVLDMINLPFIEEDAADLADLMDMASNKPLCPSKSSHNVQSEPVKLPYLMELDDKPKAGILVSCYVKDHILKLPMLMPNAKRMRELYTNCIIKDEHLNRLYNKRKDMLPKDLLDYIADFGANNEVDNNPKIIKDEIADRDQFFHTSINVYANDILREIEIESLEFSVFIKPCYILHFSKVMPDYYLINNNDPHKIEEAISNIIHQLEVDIMNPISSSRKQMMSAMMVGNTNTQVTQAFIELLPKWLEALTKGLFSPHNPIREECCYCIAFMFTQTKFIHDMLNDYSSEFVYEIISIIFKAIEHYASSFEFFYSLIGYTMDGCPLLSILQCICDKGPLSKNYMMRKRWPKFIVFACKHWPNESFKDGQFVLKKIQDLLEKSFLCEITSKTSKMALAYMGRRFERKALTCTHWVLNKCGPTDEA